MIIAGLCKELVHSIGIITRKTNVTLMMLENSNAKDISVTIQLTEKRLIMTKMYQPMKQIVIVLTSEEIDLISNNLNNNNDNGWKSDYSYSTNNEHDPTCYLEAIVISKHERKLDYDQGGGNVGNIFCAWM